MTNPTPSNVATILRGRAVVELQEANEKLQKEIMDQGTRTLQTGEYTSEIAAFVAAVLPNDKELRGLMEVNRQFHLLYNSNIVKVTGPGGSPVYAVNHASKTQLRDRHFHESGIYLRNSTRGSYEAFDELDETLPTCPVSDIEKCELHFGNLVLSIGKANDSMTVSGVGDLQETRIYDFVLFPDSEQKVSLEVEWGPTDPLEEAATLFYPHEYNNEDIEFVRFQDVIFTNPPPASCPSESDSEPDFDMEEGE